MPQHLKALRARNVDLYTSAARCIACGDRRQLHRLGLSGRLALHLQELSLSQVLVLSDRGLDLLAYLRQMIRKRGDDALRTALIGHQAPRELMMQVFGMNTRLYTTERLRLGVAGAIGRPTVSLDTATEHRLWRLWVVLADPLEPSRLREADHWLLIALELPQRLRSAWSLIQRWARDKGARKASAGDRARLSQARLRQAEQELRDRHGLPASADESDGPPDGAMTQPPPPPCVARLAA